MRLLVILVFAASIILSGCVTPYQPKSVTGGYSEIQLDENIYRVSFQGNDFASKKRVLDFTLLRCAEIAQEEGYKYFVIKEENEHTRKSSYTTPQTSTTTGEVYTYGDYGYGSATTTTVGGQTYNSSEHTVTNTIILLDEKPEEGVAYNAKLVAQEIRSNYSQTGKQSNDGE